MWRAAPVPNPEVSSSSDVPIASTVVSLGTPSSGKPIRHRVSMAAPLMPLNIATLATSTHTGSMNQ